MPKPIDLVFLGCVDQLSFKLWRQFFEIEWSEGILGGVDEFLSRLKQYFIEVLSLVELCNAQKLNLADHLLYLFPIVLDELAQRLHHSQLAHLVEEVCQRVHARENHDV